MQKLVLIIVLVAVSIQATYSQNQYTTPVPIIKQIDRHNDDGSYTYGYEAADKSYKIETKYPSGEVYGKYGYVDDQGKVREIEYGASKRGFEPAGTDINVPPPTLNNNNNPYPLGPNQVDDGQYREDPSIYYKDEKYNRPAITPSKFSLNDYRPQPAYAPQPQQPRYTSTPPQYYQQPSPQPPRYQAPATYQQPYYQPRPQPQYSPYNNVPQPFHPAIKNLDIYIGSYSIDYTGRK